MSLAVAQGHGFTHDAEDGECIDHIDIRRAYFHAPAKRQVFIELADEDATPGMCGKLVKSMYGARDAA